MEIIIPDPTIDNTTETEEVSGEPIVTIASDMQAAKFSNVVPVPRDILIDIIEQENRKHFLLAHIAGHSM